MTAKQYRIIKKLPADRFTTSRGGQQSNAHMTQAEVGRIMGITRARVQQIERIALYKIRIRLAAAVREANPELADQILKLA